MEANGEPYNSDTLLVSQPASHRQRLLAYVVAAMLFVGVGVSIPFATTPLRQLVVFVPTVEVAIFVTALVTAVLLFAQFSIDGSPALLIIASGYLFAAFMVIPHLLSIPGAFAPSGLIGGAQSMPLFFIAWYTGFSVALLAYVWMKNKERVLISHRTLAIGWGVAIIFALVCGIVSIGAVGSKLLPRFYLDAVHPTPLLHYVLASVLLICVLALTLLWTRLRSALDQWLIIVACAACAQLVFGILPGATRFSVGFYTGRIFSLVTASILLVGLLVDLEALYGRIAQSNMLMRRERNNKLMTLEAMSTAITHEVRQPLTAIAMNSEAMLSILECSPPTTPNLDEMRSILTDIIADSHRTSETFNNLRALFAKSRQEKRAININETIRRALYLARGELRNHRIVVVAALESQLPLVVGHEGQLSEVLINLVNNAVEAMRGIKDRKRTLRIRTKRHGDNEIAVSVDDSGPGIDPDKLDDIFDAFISTKSGGMGLGLAICRMIVDQHGGRISASSSVEGGAAFHFVLPTQMRSSPMSSL